MTREEIIRMAREADLLVTTPIPDDSVFVADLERFAALVAADEREACAQIVDANAAACRNNLMLADVLSSNAAAIRARGKP